MAAATLTLRDAFVGRSSVGPHAGGHHRRRRADRGLCADLDPAGLHAGADHGADLRRAARRRRPRIRRRDGEHAALRRPRRGRPADLRASRPRLEHRHLGERRLPRRLHLRGRRHGAWPSAAGTAASRRASALCSPATSSSISSASAGSPTTPTSALPRRSRRASTRSCPADVLKMYLAAAAAARRLETRRPPH